MALFGDPYGCEEGGWGKKGPVPKISQTYSTTMNINYMIHLLSSADISIFYWKSAIFLISRNPDIDCILMHNFQFF